MVSTQGHGRRCKKFVVTTQLRCPNTTMMGTHPDVSLKRKPNEIARTFDLDYSTATINSALSRAKKKLRDEGFDPSVDSEDESLQQVVLEEARSRDPVDTEAEIEHQRSRDER